MNKKKTLWIVLIVAAVLAAAVVLFLTLGGEKQPADETSGETTASRATVTWKKPQATEATGTVSDTAATTKKAETKTEAQVSKTAIPDKSECRSIAIGGGDYYYAVGYKVGDELTKELVTACLRTMEERHQIDDVASQWFAGTVYPRDTKHDPRGHADGVLLKQLRKDGLTIGVIDGNAPLASFENGQAVGFEIDVAKTCFALYNLEPKFVKVTAENAAEKLNDGSVNLIWGGLRDESVKGINYSAMNEWNLENEMCYYTLGVKRYKGETALLDETEKLGVVKNTLCGSFVKERLKAASYSDKIVEFDTVRDAFAAMKDGNVDCVACDYLSAYAMWKKG